MEPMIVYIAGYGRSGSTIFDMLFNMHSAIMGAGELARIFDQWNQKQKCSCGEYYQDCAFWSQVMAKFQTELPDITLEDAARITLSVEKVTNLWRFSANRFCSMEKMYGRIWRILLEAIVTVNNAPVVVDSSKSTRVVTARPLALAKFSQIPVKIIHLVRDPRAVTWSYLRGSNRKLEAGEPAKMRGGVPRVVLSWMITNAFVQFGLTKWQGEIIRVRYEDLVINPIPQLERLAQGLHLDLDGITEQLQHNKPIMPGHGVAGNRLRRMGVQQLRLDDEWRTHLSAFDRNLVRASWPLAHTYGYRINQY